MRNTILWEYHDMATAGHPGVEHLHKQVREYIATCESSQRNKRGTGIPPGHLHPLEIPTGRWASIGVDFVTSLPLIERKHDTILVIVDRLTRKVHFIPTVSTITAQGLANLFVEQYVKYHGLPVDIVSDRDSKFTS
ncbi:Retrotransposable element [Phytophthora megakarya]|uniref:Retrotransposable element n=1 Tax=Phytophthora megakarya TaxID=4795 RepID=A0A225WHW5_9STRA|nr:Retrotransposable element [Phytophthora megakarya]